MAPPIPPRSSPLLPSLPSRPSSVLIQLKDFISINSLDNNINEMIKALTELLLFYIDEDNTEGDILYDNSNMGGMEDPGDSNNDCSNKENDFNNDEVNGENDDNNDDIVEISLEGLRIHEDEDAHTDHQIIDDDIVRPVVRPTYYSSIEDIEELENAYNMTVDIDQRIKIKELILNYYIKNNREVKVVQLALELASMNEKEGNSLEALSNYITADQYAGKAGSKRLRTTALTGQAGIYYKMNQWMLVENRLLELIENNSIHKNKYKLLSNICRSFDTNKLVFTDSPDDDSIEMRVLISPITPESIEYMNAITCEWQVDMIADYANTFFMNV